MIAVYDLACRLVSNALSGAVKKIVCMKRMVLLLGRADEALRRQLGRAEDEGRADDADVQRLEAVAHHQALGQVHGQVEAARDARAAHDAQRLRSRAPCAQGRQSRTSSPC